MAHVNAAVPQMPVDLSMVTIVRVYASSRVSWSYYVFEASEANMRASGLIFDETIIPSQKVRSTRWGRYREKCSRLGDGRLRLKMDVSTLMTRDQAFQRFKAGILADRGGGKSE